MRGGGVDEGRGEAEGFAQPDAEEAEREGEEIGRKGRVGGEEGEEELGLRFGDVENRAGGLEGLEGRKEAVGVGGREGSGGAKLGPGLEDGLGGD